MNAIDRERARLRRALRSGVACLDGGSVHAYVSTGLDVIDHHLRRTRRCVWCEHTDSQPY